VPQEVMVLMNILSMAEHHGRSLTASQELYQVSIM
jgi:hypothetical protein